MDPGVVTRGTWGCCYYGSHTMTGPNEGHPEILNACRAMQLGWKIAQVCTTIISGGRKYMKTVREIK